ncbi:MAG: peptidase M20, partial [Chloroflexi bacterium]|nr:peptidase M20 [Chloroflexota bacterium]
MANRERLLNTLVDLIRIDSPSGEEDAIDLELSSRLEALGCQVQHDSFNNIIAKLPGPNAAVHENPVLLSAHMDTVDP